MLYRLALFQGQPTIFDYFQYAKIEVALDLANGNNVYLYRGQRYGGFPDQKNKLEAFFVGSVKTLEF